MAQGLENRLVGFYEKVDSGQKSISLDELVQIAVSKQEQLVGSRFASLENCLLGVLKVRAGVVSEEECYFFDSLSRFDFLQNFVVFLDKVFENLFEQGHALVLAQVSEVGKIFLENCRVALFDANID